MKVSNSGKIYAIPLDFNLGYAVGKLMDFTDISPFTGVDMYIFNFFTKELSAMPSIKDIDALDVLFGPTPLNKYPNVKGRGAWKYLGQLKEIEREPPEFKVTNYDVSLYNTPDWSQVPGWKKLHNFNYVSDLFDYETIRHLETKFIYDMQKLQERATMHYLLLEKKRVSDYYDLTDTKFYYTYIQIINTSFDKTAANKYLKDLKTIRS